MKPFGILALAFSTLAASSAFAQSAPRLSPQAVIVNPVQTALQVNIGVDRAGDNPVYNVGEKIRINVNVNQDAYVYVFSIHADGVVDLILPNKLSGGNEFLRGGETRTFPPQGAGYELSIDGPAGQDKLLAVASKRQLNLGELATFKGGQPFAQVNTQGQEGLARTLAVVVTPVPAQDWTTDYAQLQVRGTFTNANPPAQPQPSAPVSNGNNGNSGGISINVNVNVNIQPGSVVYPRYNLTLLPTMNFVRYETREEDRVQFLYTSSNPMSYIADGYRRQLEGRGWRAKKSKVQNTSVEIQFQNRNQKLEFSIEREGNAFRLKIEVD
jgi:Domain of unknown function (DUF4384)